MPDKPSLAVLPFQNMSGDPEQEYFADGIVEEITTAISRFPWLSVIARNSSFTYKGKAVDVRQVARELGVRYVLEGSVRKAGNRVRITGQLIDAATGAHLWADRFDGSLDDIFDLQDRGRIACRRRHRAKAAPQRNRPRQPQADREPRRLRPLPARAGADIQKDRGGRCRVDPAGPPRARTRSRLCSGHGKDCRFADNAAAPALDPGVGCRGRGGDPYGAAGARRHQG